MERLKESSEEVREALENNGLTFAQAEVQMVPNTYVSLDENKPAFYKNQNVMNGVKLNMELSSNAVNFIDDEKLQKLLVQTKEDLP